MWDSRPGSERDENTPRPAPLRHADPDLLSRSGFRARALADGMPQPLRDPDPAPEPQYGSEARVPDGIAYHLACAPLDATVTDLVHVAGCRWKTEECFQSAKNECGLDQYEVRRYVGWYRHITLAVLAHTFLERLLEDVDLALLAGVRIGDEEPAAERTGLDVRGPPSARAEPCCG